VLSESKHLNEGRYMNQCPCGTGKTYTDCCGVFIKGKQHPATPEELMRSRYTAYTEANIPYIMQTMKSPASDGYNAPEARAWAKQVKWQKLEVLHASQDNTKGYVEFIAYFSDQNKNQTIHELSEFDLIDGVWFYVKGRVM